jgi:hypothetical protein
VHNIPIYFLSIYRSCKFYHRVYACSWWSSNEDTCEQTSAWIIFKIVFISCLFIILFKYLWIILQCKESIYYLPHIRLCIERHGHGWTVGNPASYSGGLKLDSWFGNRPSWLRFFVIFIRPSRQILFVKVDHDRFLLHFPNHSLNQH